MPRRKHDEESKEENQYYQPLISKVDYEEFQLALSRASQKHREEGPSRVTLRDRVRQQHRASEADISALAPDLNVLSLDYMAGVPDENIKSFVATTEVRLILRALLPELMVPLKYRTHQTQTQVKRVMSACGCELIRVESMVVPGRLPVHAYIDGPADAFSPHAHQTEQGSRLRLLTFVVPNPRAGSSASLAGQGLGYSVRLVFHDLESELCFHTFHFLR